MFILSKLCPSRFLNPGSINILHKNNFYYALVVIFNRVSQSRIKEVGPDRACAEWLMRNGAYIKWRSSDLFITNYNLLPLDKTSRGVYHIKEVDATDAAISFHGFPYFHGCDYVDKIKFKNCYYIDDKALSLLKILKKSLTYLEISECASVTNVGLKSLKQLENLQTLKLEKLEYVKDINGMIKELQNALPKAEIIGQIRNK